MTADDHRDDITAQLAAYAVSVDPAQISDQVRREVGRRLIDSIACAYGALDSEPLRALRAVAEQRTVEGGCAVWGGSFRTTPELAAFVNASAIRMLDYSDYTVGGHPSDNMGAVIAACDWIDGTVDDLVAGLVVSYEVWGELGRLQLRYKGWDQGTGAAIAATCAVGRVLGLSTDQIAHALGMTVTSTVSLFKIRRGAISAWKGLAVPFAAQNSVLLACLAAKGITGPQDSFSGDFGFWKQISGEFEIERLAPGMEPVTILNTGYKHWPVEYDAQFAVWLAQQIRDAIPLTDIEHLDIYTSEWTWQTIANDPTKWAPATRETADHSLPYIVAVSLNRGRIDHDDFDPEVLTTPGYVDMMARIAVHADPEITAASHERCTFRATVRTTSGEVRKFEISEPRSKPMTDAELDDKWAMLTEKSRLSDGASRLLADLRTLDGTQRVRDLLAPLVSAD